MRSAGTFIAFVPFGGDTDQDAQVRRRLAPEVFCNLVGVLPTGRTGHRSVDGELERGRGIHSCSARPSQAEVM